ncbi:MAG: FTR1 family protein [Nitrososphaerales archaeon]
MPCLIGQTLIALREGFEAALITSIIIAYLTRLNRKDLTKQVWIGAYLSLALSVLLGAAIWFTYGAIPKSTQVLFEGVAAWIAVIVLTSMIYWMASKGRRLKEEIEHKINQIMHKEVVATFGSGSSTYLIRTSTLAFAALSFVVVFREGLETVLFLTPFLLSSVFETLAGAAAGIGVAFLLSYLIFKVGMKLNLRRFFYYTSILLTLLAAGLAGYGTHELLEYSKSVGLDLGWLSKNAYALNIPDDSILHHKGAIGSIFAVMFGYTIKAEWLRVFVHLIYLAVTLPLILYAYSNKRSSN